jgi:hypothetical protein
VSEYGAIDAMIDRMAREEQDDIDRNQGQFLLDVMAAEEHRKQAGEHPILEAMNRAHQAKVEADKG